MVLSKRGEYLSCIASVILCGFFRSPQVFEGNEGTAQDQAQAVPIATTHAAVTASNHPKINTSKTNPAITKSVANRSPNNASNKEGLKLLMQIQQDKNELMESFRELIGVQLPHPPQREKNHVDLFFESVSSSVKALSPKLVAEAKMRVSQLICELELRALKDNSENGHIAGTELPMTTPKANSAHLVTQAATGQQSIALQPQFGNQT